MASINPTSNDHKHSTNEKKVIDNTDAEIHELTTESELINTDIIISRQIVNEFANPGNDIEQLEGK